MNIGAMDFMLAVLPPAFNIGGSQLSAWDRFKGMQWPLQHRLTVAKVNAKVQAEAGVLREQRQALILEVIQRHVPPEGTLDDETAAAARELANKPADWTEEEEAAARALLGSVPPAALRAALQAVAHQGRPGTFPMALFPAILADMTDELEQMAGGHVVKLNIEPIRAEMLLDAKDGPEPLTVDDLNLLAPFLEDAGDQEPVDTDG